MNIFRILSAFENKIICLFARLVLEYLAVIVHHYGIFDL